MRLYADHNATSPLRPQAREAMLAALHAGGNPSSVHGEGRAARAILEDAREQLAGVLQARADDLTFTSGATEALHLAMESAQAAGFGPVFVSASEHDAVWAFASVLWPGHGVIPVDKAGRADMGWLEQALAGPDAGDRPLIILQAANNETGVIQPLEQAAALVRSHGGALLCDAVQAAGKIRTTRFTGMADWLVLSSHKIGGPTGGGALVTLPGTSVDNRRPGGGQERGARAGTQNLPAIAGFAAAAGAAMTDEAVDAFVADTGAARDGFEAVVTAALPVTVIAGAAPRLANTSCVALSGWEAARQVMALDLAGAAVSAGAACSSGKVKTSRVLAAGGWPPDISGCAIRASFGWTNGPSDGDHLAQLYLNAAARVAKPVPEKV